MRSGRSRPCRRAGPGPYLTRHGFGYSVFEHAQDGLSTSMTVHVAVDAPVKFWHVRIRNRSGRARTVTATGYVEWVLGDDPGRNRDARRLRARPPDRRHPGPELLQPGVPGPRGVLRRERAEPDGDRRPARVPGQERHAGPAGGHGTGPSLRPGGRGARPVRRAPGPPRDRGRPGPRRGLHARRRPRRRRGTGPGPAVPGPGPGPRLARVGPEVLGLDPLVGRDRDP